MNAIDRQQLGLASDLPAKIRLNPNLALHVDGDTYSVGIIPEGPVFSVAGPGVFWIDELLDSADAVVHSSEILEFIVVESPLELAESYSLLNDALRELLEAKVIEVA